MKKVNTLDVGEVHRALSSGNERVFLIDVREPSEYLKKHIPNAISIPLGDVSVDKLPDKYDKLIVHCLSGRRSEQACQKLLVEDPNLNIFSMVGGISAWEKNGFNVSSQGKQMLPLDRQMQISAGAMVCLGSLLGYHVNPLWLLLSGFVGLGLMFAGITGHCGLIKILARMPWNK